MRDSVVPIDNIGKRSIVGESILGINDTVNLDDLIDETVQDT